MSGIYPEDSMNASTINGPTSTIHKSICLIGWSQDFSFSIEKKSAHYPKKLSLKKFNGKIVENTDTVFGKFFTMRQSCPACGAPINSRAIFSLTITCEYCGAACARKPEGIELLGKQSTLLDDITPFQVGTTGKYHDFGFEVLGRIRLRWKKGFWNEWCLLFPKNRYGWLAEAQGTLSVLEEKPIDLKALDPESLKAGKKVELNGIPHSYKVVDMKTATVHGLEGELPLEVKIGEKQKSFDLLSQDGSFATLQTDKISRWKFFLGHYTKFRRLKLKNYRKIEGW